MIMKKITIKGVILSGLIALIGLPSCQVMNKYKTPDTDSENLFRDKNPSDTTTIANIAWPEYFTDPFLQSYIEEGLNGNYDMLIATERIKQAEANLGMARAAYFPDVAFSGQVQHNRNSNGANGKDILGYHSTDYSLGIAVAWEADIWGKLNRQSRSKYAQQLCRKESGTDIFDSEYSKYLLFLISFG